MQSFTCSLFNLSSSLQTVQHGFPNKPTALAWDPSLRLMIIGTASGAIKVYPFYSCRFFTFDPFLSFFLFLLIFIIWLQDMVLILNDVCEKWERDFPITLKLGSRLDFYGHGFHPEN